MGRKPKLYIPLTVTFFEDERIIEAGDAATLLYLAMCLRCKAMGTDGRLREAQIQRLNRPRWKPELAKLASLGLVVRDEVTQEWCIAGWFGHNESLAEIDDKRAADRERKAAEAERRRGLDSGRNPSGIGPDSALKEREGKGMEGKGRNRHDARGTRAVHAFEHDGAGNCACGLPPDSRFHLRIVGDAS